MMERCHMLMDWQDQYSENGYLAESNLQIQCNSHQNLNSIHQLELERAMCEFISNNKKPRIEKTLLNDKRISGGIIMLDLKLYYRAIVIKTAWYSDTNKLNNPT
jgi:hypothetical protein